MDTQSPREIDPIREKCEHAFAIGALVFGTLSLVVAAGQLVWLGRTGGLALGIRAFVACWGGVALVAGIAAWLGGGTLSAVARDDLARRVMPPMVALLGTSVLFFWNGAAYSMAVSWLVCYGLALLAARDYLPSVVQIGWLFLGTGVGLMTVVYLSFRMLSGYDRSDGQTLYIMALTFGGFHLLHAIGHLRRPTKSN